MSAPGGGPSVAACPEPGALLAYLDGALDPGARAELEAHASGCAGCTAELDRMRFRAASVREWLERHDVQAPTRDTYRLGKGPRLLGADWRVAAGIVVAVGVAVGPARAWVLGVLDERSGVEQVAPKSTAGPTSNGAATSVAADGPEIVLDFRALPPGRTLRVERTDDPLVTLRAPGPDIEVAVHPGAFRVHDAGGPGGEYRVALPAGVSRLRIRRTGFDDRVLDVPDGARATTYSLSQ